MRRMAFRILAGLMVLGWIPGVSQAQGVRSAAEIALDSLLMLPVSTVSKYSQRQTEAPAFVTIVTRQEILDFGYRTLEEALRAQVGFYSGSDREYSDVGFRGFGRPGYYNNKLLVLVDGHSVNDNYTGGSRPGTAQAVDLDSVERIEIVRGPGSSMYGARAMLAVVNLVTRKGRDLDGTEVIGDLGSAAAHGASLRYGRVLSSDSDLAVSASWASDDGEDVYFQELDAGILNDGVAESLDWTRTLRGLATIRLGNLSIQGSFSDREKGIPTGAYRTIFNHRDTQSRDRLMFAEVQYNRALGSAAEISGRGYSDSYENHSIYPFADPEADTDEFGAVRIEPRIRVGSVGGEARIRWDSAPGQRLVIGVEALRNFLVVADLLRGSERTSLGDHPYSILSGFVHQEFQISPELALSVGIRRDIYSSHGSATTPRGALVYHPFASSTFKLLVGEAYRAPNIRELYITAPGTAVLPNPELEAERVRSLELVWEQRIGPLALTSTVFHNQIRGLIDLVPIQTPDSLTGYGRLSFQQVNLARARAAGFELETRVMLPGGIMAKTSYGLHDAVDGASRDPLVNSPRHLFRFSGAGSLWGRARLGAQIRAESSRSTLYGFYLDPIVVADFTLSSSTLYRGLTTQLVVKNLFDSDQLVPGGAQHVQTAIPQRGRSIVLRVGFSW